MRLCGWRRTSSANAKASGMTVAARAARRRAAKPGSGGALTVMRNRRLRACGYINKLNFRIRGSSGNPPSDRELTERPPGFRSFPGQVPDSAEIPEPRSWRHGNDQTRTQQPTGFAHRFRDLAAWGVTGGDRRRSRCRGHPSRRRPGHRLLRYGAGLWLRRFGAAAGQGAQGTAARRDRHRHQGGLRPTNQGGVERDASPAWIRRGVDESLKALGTDYIDVYQVHWPDPKTPFEQTAQALDELKAEGKIRHVGVSNFDAEQLAEFSRTLLSRPFSLHTTCSAAISRLRSPSLHQVGRHRRFWSTGRSRTGC